VLVLGMLARARHRAALARRSLRGVRKDLDQDARHEETTTMASTNQAEDAQAIADEAWKPITFGEGPRVGVLGDSGCGKTEAMRRLIDAYQRRSPGPVIVVDDKEPQPQFEGQCRRDVAELESKPPDPDGPRVIVLRGDRNDRLTGEVDPETAAELQWGLAQKKIPSLVVYDELDKAASGGQWRRGDKKSTILWAFTRGRSSGASSLWGTQETQAVPAQAFNQSSLLLVFRMTGNPLRLLGERGYLEPRGEVEKVIPTLAGDELPKAQRGYFVALRRGRPWDNKVWRFM
jgi:energy-coupling factor transporter ATP-binding protein EcfA2